MNRIRVIDSHTGGEPTRVIVAGGPDLGTGPMAERLERFRREFDHIRSAVVNEPRGNDAIVGALLCEPSDAACDAGVIFFDNAGFLNMCGHGSIGLAVTLAHMGRARREMRFETVCGVVEARLLDANRATIRNVASYRYAEQAAVEAPGIGTVRGDIAWGGNWFFLVSEHGQKLTLERVEELTDYAWRVRQGVDAQGFKGPDGRAVDHIELFGPPSTRGADSKNFVLCPGKAYDRSPCGTGTSAKLACLYAEGRLQPGQIWRQESITGSVFEGTVRLEGGALYPEITGSAYVNAEADLIVDERDPFAYGIPGRWVQAAT